MHILSSPRQQSHHYTSSRCFIKKSNGCKLSTSPPGRKKIVLVWYNNKTFQFNLSLLVWSFTSYTTHTHHIWWIFWNILISPVKTDKSSELFYVWNGVEQLLFYATIIEHPILYQGFVLTITKKLRKRVINHICWWSILIFVKNRKCQKDSLPF